MKDIKIKYSKMKVFWILFISFIFTFTSLMIFRTSMKDIHYNLLNIFSGAYKEQFKELGASILGIIVFGFCLIVSIYFFFTKKPQMIIGKDGITMTAPLAVNFMAWSEIESFHMDEPGTDGATRKKYIEINVYNSEKLKQENTKATQALMNATEDAGFSTVTISLYLANMKMNKLYQILQKRLEEYKKTHEEITLNK